MATHVHTFTRQTVWFPKRRGFYCTETCKIELGKLSGPTKASINLMMFVAISGQKPPLHTSQFPWLSVLVIGIKSTSTLKAHGIYGVPVLWMSRDLHCRGLLFFFLYQMSLYSLRIQHQIQMQNLDLAPLVHCQQYLSWTHFWKPTQG